MMKQMLRKLERKFVWLGSDIGDRGGVNGTRTVCVTLCALSEEDIGAAQPSTGKLPDNASLRGTVCREMLNTG